MLKGKKKKKIKYRDKNCLPSIGSYFVETFLELSRHMESESKGKQCNVMGKRLHQRFRTPVFFLL